MPDTLQGFMFGVSIILIIYLIIGRGVEMGGLKLPDPQPGRIRMLWTLALILLGTSIYLYRTGPIIAFITE